MYESILRKVVNVNPFSDVVYTVTNTRTKSQVNVTNLRHDDFGNPIGMLTAARREFRDAGLSLSKGDKFTWYKTLHSSSVPKTLQVELAN